MEIKSYSGLRGYSYFSSLSDNALRELIKKATKVKFPANAEIFSKEEKTDAFYLLEKGEVEVLRRSKRGNIEKIIKQGKGNEPGKMPLLTCSTRHLSINSMSELTLLKITMNDFEDIVCMDSVMTDLEEKKGLNLSGTEGMDALHPLALIHPAKLLTLSDKLEEHNFSAGQNIITQGEPGNKYYIIKSGSADVLKLMFKDEPEHVATLAQGQGFGEEALLTDQVRNATVQAREETVVWSLSRPDFDSIMKSSFMEEVSPDEVISINEEKNILDVRFNMEYDECHIPGALHIPLDEIRKRYSELDRNKKYFVYCRSGRRSASATFLMRSQGFDAVNIMGGINNWPGKVVEGESC